MKRYQFTLAGFGLVLVDAESCEVEGNRVLFCTAGEVEREYAVSMVEHLKCLEQGGTVSDLTPLLNAVIASTQVVHAQ